MQRSGQLRVIAGKIAGIEKDGEGFAVTVSTAWQTFRTVFTASLVVNCAGAEM